MTPAPPELSRNEVVIAHASPIAASRNRPRDRGQGALRAEGLPVRLDLHETLTRSQVLERVRDADIVVDQLVMGWYGGFSVEATALAKPVVCFIDEDGNLFGESLPVVRATPATVTDVLRVCRPSPRHGASSVSPPANSQSASTIRAGSRAGR